MIAANAFLFFAIEIRIEFQAHLLAGFYESIKQGPGRFWGRNRQFATRAMKGIFTILEIFKCLEIGKQPIIAPFA